MRDRKAKKDEAAKLLEGGTVATSAGGSPAKGGKGDEPSIELPDDFSDKSIDYQDAYDNNLADEIEFSEDEEDEDNVNLKGAHRFLEPYKPQNKKG